MNRRRLLRTAGASGAGLMLPGPLAALVRSGAAHAARAPSATAGTGWPLDLDGDGVVGAADRQLLADAVVRRRGDGLRPRSGWDPRLDFEAGGRLGADRLERFDRLRAALPAVLPPRPLVTCWHYGWYGPGRRRREATTVRYLGGSYLSHDRAVEERFNELKEEFGISADLLSWTRDRAWLLPLERGYLAARNRTRRRFGLLYESNISFGSTRRIDFAPASGAGARLIDDFGRMGAWLERHGGSELLLVEGRPVVYLFGSHTFGTTRRNLAHVGESLARARRAFADAFGGPPWLIGDEALFPGDPEAGFDRRYRASFFDAVGRYHHYDAAQVRDLGKGRPVRLDDDHRRRIVRNEQRTMEAFADMRCRFTDRPVEVIPGAAAGFAKRGLPRLVASGADYEALLRALQAASDEHRDRLYPDVAPARRPPTLVNVGSWNEEFEGHALMPAATNPALLRPSRHGFDWLWAVKAVYGWNHHARR